LHIYFINEKVSINHIGIPSFCSPYYYNISIPGAMVRSKLINTNFAAIMDSGTCFTDQSDPMYTEITSSVGIIFYYLWFSAVHLS
jgi:hypothetical protein